MNRRTFLGLMGVALSSKFGQAKFSSLVLRSLGQLPSNNAKAYGSGHFGGWITDEFGLPAYRYTCNQLTDPRARAPVHNEWRSPSDHTHQVGNDRLVAAVSNYGYIQVRQDEGSPKFLNDYSPENARYGGGIGFLADGNVLLTTYYPGNADSFDRIMGVGYLRKIVRGNNCEIDQLILAPFGDDPVLLSQVTVTNRGAAATNPHWIEYWGCHNYQFSYRSLMEASLQGEMGKAAQFRRDFAGRFAHQFEQIAGHSGLIERQKFLGRSSEEEAAWARVQAMLKENPTAFFGGPVPEFPAGVSFEDLDPPSTFLVSLDAPADGFATNASAFFGAGGIDHPSGAANKLNNNLATTGPDSAFLLERDLTLAPGKSQTLRFLYGYLPEKFGLEELIAKYSKIASSLPSDSSSKWKASGLRFRTASEPWVERETLWHNYYLRSNLTYDSFFHEHMLSQGHVYQYIMGFQGAARDPLQHALPFIFSDPQFVRSVIGYTLKEIQPDGSIPYGIVGQGVPMPAIFHPSDLEMWLLWLVSEYVLATRDKAFLNEKIPLYPRRDATSSDPTIGELLARSFTHLVESIGTGQHGLMRISNGDWNDNVVEGHVPPNFSGEVRQQGESVLNAAMACYVLDYYGRLLNYTGGSKTAAEARSKAEAQRQAVRAQWAGRWFRRAWLGPHVGWVGDDQLWLEPQPWAIIGGTTTPEQSKNLVTALDELVRRPSPIGAMLLSKGDPTMENPTGTGTNGGIWPSINGTLIWALALANGQMAWDEWKKNCLALHAEAYPEIWYGIWSGPDTYNSVLSKYPGQTMFSEGPPARKPVLDLGLNWTDFPVMNMHPHAWPLYSAAKLLGLEFQETGISFQPLLPMPEYEFTSSLLGFMKSADGYSGWYAPAVEGRWEIELRLSPEELARVRQVVVNGSSQSVTRTEKAIRFAGQSKSGNPLRWEVS